MTQIIRNIPDAEYQALIAANSPNAGNPFATIAEILALPSNLILYPTTVVSAIPGYNLLVNSLNDVNYDNPIVNVSTGSITGTGQLIQKFATNLGYLQGDPGIVNTSLIAEIRRTAGVAEATFYYEIYHRDNLGVETLIGTSSNTLPVSSAVYAQYDANVIFNNGNWVTTDLVVIYLYGSKVGGGSSPTFDIGYGGATPFRIIVPIPFNISNIIYSLAATGTVIDFTEPKIFGKYSVPEIGNITNDLSNAKIGVTQKIYHNHTVAPTVPAGWVLMSGSYVTSANNIIYAEWSEGTRVEYWIVQ